MINSAVAVLSFFPVVDVFSVFKFNSLISYCDQAGSSSTLFQLINEWMILSTHHAEYLDSTDHRDTKT